MMKILEEFIRLVEEGRSIPKVAKDFGVNPSNPKKPGKKYRLTSNLKARTPYIADIIDMFPHT